MSPVAARFAVRVMMLEIKEAFSFPRVEDPVMPTITSQVKVRLEYSKPVDP